MHWRSSSHWNKQLGQSSHLDGTFSLQPIIRPSMLFFSRHIYLLTSSFKFGNTTEEYTREYIGEVQGYYETVRKKAILVCW